MTVSSEQRRAAIAMIGVTGVLAIAAGIHFMAPRRTEDSIARTPLTSITRAVPTQPAPTLAAQSIGVTVVKLTRSTARRTSRSFERAIVDSRGPGMEAGAPLSAPAPLGARRAVPGFMVLVAPPGPPAATRLADAATTSSSEPQIVVRPRRRGAVTSACVTAGSAVARGFRTAARALKRAF